MSEEYQIPNEDVIRMAEKEEPRFLNIMLKDKDCLTNAISMGIKPNEKRSPGHFLIPKNNFLYAMIYKYYNMYGKLLTRSAIDSIVDMQDFITEEEKASHKGYWDKIWNRHDVSLEDYPLLRDHLNDRYILWQFYDLWKEGDRIIKSTSNHSELVKTFINDLRDIKNMDPEQYSLTMGLEEGMNEAIKYIGDRRDKPDSSDVIFTRIKAIDDIFHGFTRGSYTVISGMVNGGKTTLLMNFGFNMAKHGENVAYVSLEKTAKLFFRRTLALHAVVDYNRIMTGGRGQWGLTDYWYGKLLEAAKDLIENVKPNYHCLQFVQDTKLTKILSDVEKLRARKKIDVLIVDYLGVIGVETTTVGRYDVDAAKVHKRLQAYGRDHNITIFTALQLKSASSKEIRKKAEKAVSESEISAISVNAEDFSVSQMIVGDADNALGVVLNGDKPPTKMFISISKARDAESRRTICLDFDGKLGRICDPEYGAGQIKAVDKNVDAILFDEKTTEEDIDSEDALFGKEEAKAKINSGNNLEILKSNVAQDAMTDILSGKLVESHEEESPSLDSPNSADVKEEEKPIYKPQKGEDLTEKAVDTFDFNEEETEANETEATEEVKEDSKNNIGSQDNDPKMDSDVFDI